MCGGPARCTTLEAARPKRPARNTFLLLNGKTYPAKFIRGLAYRLATGVELDPNVDYSGGTEGGAEHSDSERQNHAPAYP
jgi:hypothetical protein